MAWMRNKSEPDPRPVSSNRTPEPNAPPQTTAAPAARETRPMDKLVNIGQSVQIKGELTGKEDLTIEGKVEGKITLNDHALTVGANGRIHGEIRAKSVVVVGEVDGNITADDKVEVAATGSMKGDIVAPRVILADGARFKGTIDMDGQAKRVSQQAAVSSAPVSTPRPTGTPVGVGGKG